jgi:hypothetical protein
MKCEDDEAIFVAVFVFRGALDWPIELWQPALLVHRDGSRIVYILLTDSGWATRDFGHRIFIPPTNIS